MFVRLIENGSFLMGFQMQMWFKCEKYCYRTDAIDWSIATATQFNWLSINKNLNAQNWLEFLWDATFSQMAIIGYMNEMYCY